MPLFTSVTNQMSSWLGNVIKRSDNKESDEIPKNDVVSDIKTNQTFTESDQADGQQQHSLERVSKNDDSSSATEGADSESVSNDSTEAQDHNPFPTLEAISSSIEDASTKAIQGARNFGNLLFSAVNKAGKTVTEAGAKIKKSVGETSILGEFNKEQDNFIKEKMSKHTEPAEPPWVGHLEGKKLKEQILSLSNDKRNFVRSPPAGVEFSYDKNKMYPVAMAILSEDDNLQKMRFDLVPKEVSEDDFWRNYFYRVSLLCQSSDLHSLAQESTDNSKELSRPSSFKVKQSGCETYLQNSGIQEFVSDSFQTTSKDLEEVKASMKLLGVDDKVPEEDWEKQLEAELQEYEIVSGQQTDSSDCDAEIEQLLKDSKSP